MIKSVRARSMRSQKSLLSTLLFLAAALAVSVPASAEDAGEELFGQCKGCHEIGAGAKHKVGPHLDGIFGRTAGTSEGFKYSAAMKKAGEDGLKWDAEALAKYIEKPRDFIKGNRMSFRGMAKEEDRKLLIEWLTAKASEAPAADTAHKVDDTGATVRGFADAVLALEGDKEYGQYLAGECVTCHQITGQVEGIPSIVGVPRDYFVRAMLEFKNNIRTNEVMKLRAANMTNEDLAALAAYFESLEPR